MSLVGSRMECHRRPGRGGWHDGDTRQIYWGRDREKDMWGEITSALSATLIEPCLFEAFGLVYIVNPVESFSARNILTYLLKVLIVFVCYAVLLVSVSAVLSFYGTDVGATFVYIAMPVVYFVAAQILRLFSRRGSSPLKENMGGGGTSICDGIVGFDVLYR